MPTSIDSLQIEINAKAQSANDAIDRLVGKLDRLSTSLGKMNTSNFNGLANGVDRLGRAMQTMNTVKTADFTRLATNLAKLGTINVSALNSTASSLSHLTRAFNTLGAVSANAQQVGTLAQNLSRLGSASMQRAITNIPQLAVALNNLMTTLSRSPRVSQNVIQMTNALANLASQGSKVGTASNSIERGLNRASTSAQRAKKSFGGLASAIGKFYATYFLLIRAIKGVGKSITSTADYLEAFNYFNVALGKIGSDWSHQFEQYGYENAEAYAESFATRLNKSLSGLSGLQIEISADGSGLLTETGLKNLGLNIKEITQYASQLASVTNSVGQTGEVSLAAASAFTKLGADLSSLFNLDYSQVMGNLQSGLIGQSRALYKYGIDITNATLQTYAYELGLEKAVSEMTQAEKMQLRMIAILDQSKVSWGDLANTINSPSNMIRQFTNNLKETGMVLGQLFIPLLQKVMPIINGVTIAIKRLLVNIAGFLGIKLDLSSFGQGFSGVEDDIDGVTDSLEDATAAAKKLKTTTLGIDELNINAPQDASGSGSGVGGGGIDLTEEILAATEEYEKVWNAAFANMENEAQAFADRITRIFDNIGERLTVGNFKGVGLYISNNIREALKDINWEDVYSGAENFGSGFAQFLNGIFNPSMFHEVGSTIAKSLNTAIYSALSFGEEFDFARFGESIAEKINGFFEDFDFEALATTLNTWADGIKKSIVSALTNIKWGDVLEGALNFLTNLELDTLTILLGAIAFKHNGSFLTSASLGGLFAKATGGKFLGGILKYAFAATFTLEAGMELGKWLGATLFPEYAEEFENLTWKKFGGMVGGALSDIGEDFSNALFQLMGGETESEYIARITELTKYANSLGLLVELSEDGTTQMIRHWDGTMVSMSEYLALMSGTYEATAEDMAAMQERTNSIAQNIDEKMRGFVESTTNRFAQAFGAAKGFFEDLLGVELSFNKTLGESTKKTEKEIGSMVLQWDSAKLDITAKVQSIGDSIVKTFDDAFLKAGRKTDTFLSGLKNSFSNFSMDGININATPGIKTYSVPAYADGGFPEDGLFFANHTELVGGFGNGRTAVANNDQIIAGIEGGVERAVARVLAPYLADIAQNTRETADKDNSVYIGDRDIARANERGRRSMGYQLIT